MAKEQDERHEATVFSIIALASLYHNTVESFGNIHSSLNDSKDEKILLAQLGIEQARLMIWGDIVGIFSPPAALASASGPLKPSAAAEPGLARALYSRPRDESLDQEEVRHNIDGILTAIAYTLSPPNYNARLDVNGLRPWQQGYAHALDQPAINSERAERLQDRYQLLLDVARETSGIERPPRHATTQWLISNIIRFSNFVKFTKLHVDKLVNATNSADEIEATLKRDIKALGEPSNQTQKRMAKLGILAKACKGWYPDLVTEAKGALFRLEAESGIPETSQKLSKLTLAKLPGSKSRPASRATSPTRSPDNGEKRPGLFTRLSTQTQQTFRKTKTPTSSKPHTPAVSRPGSPEP